MLLGQADALVLRGRIRLARQVAEIVPPCPCRADAAP
jgi:hypothetical protein